MPITFTCACGKSLQVGDEYAGRDGTCPGCGQAIHIPGPADGQITGQAPRPAPRPPPLWDRPDYDAEPDDDIAILRTHGGMPIAADEDLFVEAPAEIGTLHSQYTSLKTHVHPSTRAARLFRVLLLFTLGWAVVVGLVWVDHGMGQGHLHLGHMLPAAIVMLTAVVGCVTAGIYFWSTRFLHTCSYVGKDGIAVFQCAGDRDRVFRSEVFLFKDAAELRIAKTRQYYLGSYAGTNYAFLWFDERGQIVYRFMGRYKSEVGTPEPNDPYHFMLMAEHAWILHLMADIDRILADDELLHFQLKEGDFVRLGPDQLILGQAGRIIELHADQIEKITMGDGVITVWEVGAKKGWFASDGVHQFMYHDLGNARFFAMALEKLVKFRL
ncbi:MAG: hypothetical protein EXR98_03015 [Gemmataceae bacterium]|nr:hypothetical protein [Gemmataceae bacterium]